MRSYICFFIVLFFVCSVSCSVQSQTITIGVEKIEHFLPYSAYNIKTDNYYGYSRELLDLFAEYSNIKIKYVPLKVEELLKKFIKEEIDFKFPDNPKWKSNIKKDKRIYYSDSAVSAFSGILVHPDNIGKKINTLASIRGFTPFIFTEDIESGKIKHIEKEKQIDILKLIINKKIDGAFVIRETALYDLKIYNKNNKTDHVLIFDETQPTEFDTYHLSTIKYPDIIEKFNIFMKEKSDEIIKLKKKYRLIKQ